jgi:hypothetical protein
LTAVFAGQQASDMRVALVLAVALALAAPALADQAPGGQALPPRSFPVPGSPASPA